MYSEEWGRRYGVEWVFGLGSYKTAWAWLHKLRRAMVRPGRDPVTGRVEVDRTYIGGTNRAQGVKCYRRSRRRVGHRVDPRRPHPGRSGGKFDAKLVLVKDTIEVGSTIHADGWLGYLPVEAAGYDHGVTFLKGERTPPPGADAASESGSIAGQAVGSGQPPSRGCGETQPLPG